VYAKAPFAGPAAVLAYLSRYTHRVAISNRRLIALDERGVTFRYKDYRRDGAERYRTMTLAADEFIRRFLLDVLPKGFHRIRHYWPARQRRAQDKHRARPGTARDAAGDRSRRAGRGIRTSAAAPLLRRPHDRHRDLRALDPTARTAAADMLSRKEFAVNRHAVLSLVIAALLRSTISCGPRVAKRPASGHFGPRLLPMLVLSRAGACETGRSTPPIDPLMPIFRARLVP